MWFAGYALFTLKIIHSVPLKPEEKTEAIVALTGDSHRIQTAMDLWSDGLAPQIFISGVHRNVKKDEILKDWKQKSDKTTPECCFVIGYKATNTEENGLEVYDWVRKNNIRSIRLVTSNYHMPRSILEMRTQMPNLKIIAHPVEKSEFSLNTRKFLKITFLEYHKCIYRNFQIIGRKFGIAS